MSDWHVPEPPSTALLEYIASRWIIKPEEGIVLSRRTGEPIGWENYGGYCSLTAYPEDRDGMMQVLKHHLIWYGAYGTWPTRQIDHRDRDKLNNKIKNLREVTDSEQMCNHGGVLDKKSGLPIGVCLVNHPNLKEPRLRVHARMNKKMVIFAELKTTELDEAARLSKFVRQRIEQVPGITKAEIMEAYHA